MPHYAWSLLSVGVAAVLLVPLALPGRSESAPPANAPPQGLGTAERSPAALAALLARYDALPAGAEKDALERQIDHVAGQRYATVSRLYWHTELDAAKAAARATGRPILSLRMLGRLDEERSCANSRIFRATLYADAATSALLRERFVLHWSTERPVPRVTIDMGDGRAIETTTAGNSAHYVLDADGRVLDVLPGVYAPVAFRAELGKSLALARATAGRPEREWRLAVARHHEAISAQAFPANVPYQIGQRTLWSPADATDAMARAQRATMAKARIEVPLLRYTGHDLDGPQDPAFWAAAGQALYGIGGLAAVPEGKLGAGAAEPRPPAKRTPVRLLDERSRALVARLHTAADQRATADELARVIARLEWDVVADTGQNQLVLRKQIANHVKLNPGQPFEELNRFVYGSVFHTPREDAWLGLLPRTTFTGLPGDGVVARPRS